MTTKADAIAKLQRQIDQIDTVLGKPRRSPEFKKWYRDTEITIQNIFGESTRHLKDFTSIAFSFSAFTSSTPDSAFEQRFRDGLVESRQILTSMIQEVDEYWVESPEAETKKDKLAALLEICDRFHLVVRQIRQRHDDRPTLEVEDEYDVQDLLHGLLHLEFDDIRAEEWTPSYAGGSSRMDFLLKDESIVVEVKKTRPRLSAREVGEQLLIDIGKYQSHPGCQTLVCFVYDPEGRIANPRGLEADLTKRVNDLDVRVLIRPKGH